ncbi:MAG: transcription-repair coupling factor [Elusimicrobiota bacterium]|jgi:transcription-repair coupling factor (superfamily II helicase)|nr:transcription-repair coupling factor [Elusimicrobiota bacterium]
MDNLNITTIERISYICGLSTGAKAHYICENILKQNKNVRLFAFVKQEFAMDFYEDIKTFCLYQNIDIPVILFPFDNQPLANLAADEIKKLKSFIVCASDKSKEILICAPDAQNGIVIETAKTYNFEKLISQIANLGYLRVPFVEEKQQFAVRGEIIDIWNASDEEPTRIVFDFESVGSIRRFDFQTQLSKEYIDEIKIFSSLTQGYDARLENYFGLGNPNDTFLFFDYIIDSAEIEKYNKYNLIINDPLNSKSINLNYKSFVGFSGDVAYFLESLNELALKGLNIKFFCQSDRQREKILDLLSQKLWRHPQPEFILSNLSASFYLQNDKNVYISASEMLYKNKPVKFPKISGGKKISNVWEISAGDFVVHEKYGIGRYAGLKTLVRSDAKTEYLCIEYAKGDKLYVAADAIKKVKKYVGIEGMRPKLYSMDSNLWQRIKSKAREEAKRFAKELLDLYAQRSLVKRTPYELQTPWEKQLEDSFVYEETPDQMKAIEDINIDLAKDFPMERLICGDVGYGKTEVALRAAFKVASAGKQVAVLAPTTVLAAQHYNTFSDRLGEFPERVEMLSRFQSVQTQNKILKSLADGQVDILIGTHRILQKDVSFSNLGLLIIDEEHRFGVKQKEYIKDLKKSIDVLMMSATPIPRTLSSALSGFRDLSVIETPPLGRLAIETYLSDYDEKIVSKIILAELARNGQVFYVYNTVENMLQKAQTLKRLAPDAKIAILHGQMPSKEIEKTMWEFTHQKFDVLLASTIIESGLDIPMANTMIIEDAQNFGLSQLYQLRGRIGRQQTKAYCYLFYDRQSLTQEAVLRLEAMKEFSELGSGFRLAMKDLEIRGAGGILSKNQHGFVRDIGYDMFLNLLKQEGQKIKGAEISQDEDETLCEIALKITAFIPENFINDENTRIAFYRKLAEAANNEQIEKIRLEVIDRFGKIPSEMQLLFESAKLRLFAAKLSLERISQDNDRFYFFFYKRANFVHADFEGFMDELKGQLEFIAGDNYGFAVKRSFLMPKNDNANANVVLEAVERFLSKLKIYLAR